MGGGKLLIALALLFALAVPVGAQDEWVYIGYDQQGTLYYLDRSSIEDHGSYVTGWIRLSNVFKGHVTYHMILFGAAKGTKQIRQFQVTMYGENGDIITTISAQQLERMERGQWQYCIPNTIGESIWQALMQAAGIRY